MVPLAILIAGLAIAASIFFNRSGSGEPEKISVTEPNTSRADAFVPVTSKDHVKGDLSKARIIIVDYSDLECPYCKMLHETIEKVYSDYESTGEVAWVYRHFPLSIHNRSTNEAHAAECVAELGGDDAFWQYIDLVFDTTQSNDTLPPEKLLEFAKTLKIDSAKFDECQKSGRHAQRIKSDFSNAYALAGTEITPYTVMVVNGRAIPLANSNNEGLGALPYGTFRALVDQFLKQGS